MNKARIHESLREQFGKAISLDDPCVVDELIKTLGSALQAQGPASKTASADAAPFGVSWMDSWAAHWVFGQNLEAARERDVELEPLVRGLVDLKFDQRIRDIRDFIDRVRGGFGEPPDGGPPEPGVPPDPTPPGPSPAIFVTPGGGPPDGGPPEPGVPDPPPAGPSPAIFATPDGGAPHGVPDPPPAGPSPAIFVTPGGGPPDGGPPEPGVPDPPPAPGPSGPDAHGLYENPWILLWFLSIKAPVLLDMIDAQLSRRLDAAWEQANAGR